MRADNLLKDGDNLIQRYRNLEARLQKQAEAQHAMEGEYQKFKTQAESTSTWISDLLQPITSPGRDTETEEIKCKALVCGTQTHFSWKKNYREYKTDQMDHIGHISEKNFKFKAKLKTYLFKLAFH